MFVPNNKYNAPSRLLSIIPLIHSTNFTLNTRNVFLYHGVVLIQNHRCSIDFAPSDFPPCFWILGRNFLPQRQGCQGNSPRVRWLQNSGLISLVWFHLQDECDSVYVCVYVCVSPVCIPDCKHVYIYIYIYLYGLLLLHLFFKIYFEILIWGSGRYNSLHRN